MITESATHFSDWSTPARTAWVVRERMAYERVAAMYRATPLPVAVGAAFAALCGVVLLRVADAPSVGLWWLLLLALSGWRIHESRRFARDPQRHARRSHWERRYLLLLAAYGLAWSAMLLLAGPRINGFVFTFLLAGLLGVLSIGVYTTHSLFRASALWLGTITLPLLLWCLWRGDTDGLVMGLGTLLFVAVMLREAQRSSRLLGEMQRLRLAHAAVAADRAEALAQAEQSSRAKTRFLAAISHEMRTPLNGIVGISEVLRDEATDPLLRQRADLVLRSAELLHRVIGDLLDLSRLEFGRLALASAPFDPARALREVLAMSALVASERGLRLDLEIDPSVPRRVAGDAERVKQVLHSLLAHTLATTTDGGVRVQLAPSSQGLRCTVIDTGPGIAAERLATLFEPFDAAEGDASSAGIGIGLGLALARRLARAMNGDLSCDSSPGQGSRFVFTMHAPVCSDSPVLPPGVAAPEPPLPRLRGRVLVVDDNEVNATVAQAMLHRLGVVTDCARDGAEALVQMARGVYHAVLMDCRMPVLDGWEATRRWREQEAEAPGRRLAIVGVTANVSEADRQHCLACGMDDFLAKPFRLHELAERLRPHLPHQLPPAPGPQPPGGPEAQASSAA